MKHAEKRDDIYDVKRERENEQIYCDIYIFVYSRK